MNPDSRLTRLAILALASTLAACASLPPAAAQSTAHLHQVFQLAASAPLTLELEAPSADLEIFYSATSHRVLLEVIAERETGFRLVDTRQEDWDRAVEVMVLLAEKGKHRSVGIPDLLIAAVAERHDLTLVHYDSDFDHVLEVTGQPTRWLAPRGTW